MEYQSALMEDKHYCQRSFPSSPILFSIDRQLYDEQPPIIVFSSKHFFYKPNLPIYSCSNTRQIFWPKSPSTYNLLWTDRQSIPKPVSSIWKYLQPLNKISLIFSKVIWKELITLIKITYLETIWNLLATNWIKFEH